MKAKKNERKIQVVDMNATEIRSDLVNDLVELSPKEFRENILLAIRIRYNLRKIERRNKAKERLAKELTCYV